MLSTQDPTSLRPMIKMFQDSEQTILQASKAENSLDLKLAWGTTALAILGMFTYREYLASKDTLPSPNHQVAGGVISWIPGILVSHACAYAYRRYYNIPAASEVLQKEISSLTGRLRQLSEAERAVQLPRLEKYINTILRCDSLDVRDAITEYRTGKKNPDKMSLIKNWTPLLDLEAQMRAYCASHIARDRLAAAAA